MQNLARALVRAQTDGTMAHWQDARARLAVLLDDLDPDDALAVLRLVVTIDNPAHVPAVLTGAICGYTQRRRVLTLPPRNRKARE